MLALALQFAPLAPCAQGVPVPATIAEIKAHPARFAGHCLTMEALTDGKSLFTSQAALTQQHRAVRTRYLTRRELTRRMGVYQLPDLPEDLRDRQFDTGLRWRMTGVIDTCGDMYDRARREIDREPVVPGEVRILMLGGYCHNWSGPVLIVRDAVRLP